MVRVQAAAPKGILNVQLVSPANHLIASDDNKMAVELRIAIPANSDAHRQSSVDFGLNLTEGYGTGERVYSGR